jgi:hypothetical protein
MKAIGLALASIWLMLCVAPSLGGATDNFSGHPCAKEQTIECLHDNFERLYLENYSLFWKMVYHAASSAKKCTSVRDTASFLNLAPLGRGNAEYSESFNRTIEELCIQKPDCFLNGLLRTDEAAKGTILDELKTPVFVEPSQIDRVFRRAKANKKYSELSTAYFSKSRHGGRRPCTVQDAQWAEEHIDLSLDWAGVYKLYKNFGNCDDGSIAEGFSDVISNLLADEWNTAYRLNQLTLRDKGFERFVLRHVDELMSPEQSEKIRNNADARCPRHARQLCKAVSARLREVDKAVRKEKKALNRTSNLRDQRLRRIPEKCPLS